MVRWRKRIYSWQNKKTRLPRTILFPVLAGSNSLNTSGLWCSLLRCLMVDLELKYLAIYKTTQESPWGCSSSSFPNYSSAYQLFLPVYRYWPRESLYVRSPWNVLQASVLSPYSSKFKPGIYYKIQTTGHRYTLFRHGNITASMSAPEGFIKVLDTVDVVYHCWLSLQVHHTRFWLWSSWRALSTTVSIHLHDHDQEKY
jgi:hypothetical protein